MLNTFQRKNITEITGLKSERRLDGHEEKL